MFSLVMSASNYACDDELVDDVPMPVCLNPADAVKRMIHTV